MKKIVVTVSIKKDVVEGSGKIHIIDPDSGLIERTVPFVLPSVHSSYPNPKNALRGYRGLEYFNGKFLVANWDSILTFDKELNLLSKFKHPYFSDIHEIRIFDDDLYVVNTFTDSILKLGIDKNCVISKCEIFWEGGLKLNPEIDYRYIRQPEKGHHHYNSILKHSNGEFYALASNDNIVMNITKNIGIKLDLLASGHDLTELDGRIFMSNTDHNEIVSFNPDGTDYRVEYKDVRLKINHGNSKIGESYGFLLGLCFDEDHCYVGTSPASIKVFSRRDRNLVKIIKISDDVEEGVHEIKMLEDFA